MFFSTGDSRTYIARPATITNDNLQEMTPTAAAGSPFGFSLEDTTVRRWQLPEVPVEQIAEWDAGDGRQLTLSGIGLARCNLSGAMLTLQHRQAAADPWVAAVVRRLPAGPLHVAEIFAEVSARYWQLRLADPPASGEVSWIWLGEWLRLPRGPEPPFTPPGLSEAYQVSSHLAVAAQTLGARAQRAAGETTLRISEVAISYLSGEWEPVRRHLAQSRSLFFIPDTAVGNVGLVQAAGRVPPTRQRTGNLGEISLQLRYIP